MIVGSTALNYLLGYTVREPKDLDLITPYPAGAADRFWDDRLNEYADAWWAGAYSYPTLDELYTIKVSHAYWELENNSWGKHMYDTVLLKRAGANLIQPFHDLLYRIWVDLNGKKKMSFKEDGAFFKDAVPRIYDHDSIHDSVAFNDQAMYIQTLQRTGHTAVDMDYIKGMKYEDQVLLFREEVAATALERKLIPGGYRGSPGAAYLWALRRTITSLTKGWSAQFIVEHYEDFMVPDNYLDRHRSKRERLIKL